MRRFVPILVAGAAFIAAACRDSIAPTRSVGLQTFGGPVVFSVAVNHDVQTKTTVFTIDPAGGRVKVGDFWLDYPASSVCNPETSGYGPETWELPCETLDAPITITATTWREGQVSYVDFSPDIRFAPDKEVFLSTKRKAKDAEEFQSFHMWYFVTVGETRYTFDEAAVDQTVQTQREFSSKRVWRRVKHFSGISLSSGEPCDETMGDPECISIDGSFMLQMDQ